MPTERSSIMNQFKHERIGYFWEMVSLAGFEATTIMDFMEYNNKKKNRRWLVVNTLIQGACIRQVDGMSKISSDRAEDSQQPGQNE